jgi:quercetin dioxygenase-like cupin family protein
MSEQARRKPLSPHVGGMLSLSIPEEVARLKAKPEWPTQDRLAMSLVKDDALNILLMVLKEGARLNQHRTKGPIALHVLSGAVRFSAGSEQAVLSSGKMVALDRDIAHNLTALEESVALLITSIA